VVVRQPGSRLDAGGVRARAAEALAPFKVPAHVEFRNRLPRNAAGKVMSHLLEVGDAVPFAEDD
jgi:acyl-coenzyme A synthetase/AMP-(fatty) acid ligase